ncbi:uncharacterized protein LOC124354184 isoform X1 [Homalodisca vitripennis]|uniref:uncharacterized protein LOC124354184 isoform X1 n=1 Tax=Homalodisca vitripennis TaxID=197043 RepID=UPI001EECCEE0|nr:uncharacterized protein LOC124354184 isoform X1 [Homalodisca vitripennis]
MHSDFTPTMRQLVALTIVLCSVLYPTTGYRRHEPSQLMPADYAFPASFYAPGIVPPAASFTPERGYHYVSVDTPFYHHQEYAPVYCSWVPSLNEPTVLKYPILNDDYLYPDPGANNPPGWIDSGFHKENNVHNNPFESGMNEIFINRNPLFTTFTSTLPSKDSFDTQLGINPPYYPSPSSTSRPPENITPVFKPAITTSVISSVIPNIIRGQNDQSLIPAIPEENLFTPIESNTQPLETVNGSVISPVLLSSLSPNIIRGENDGVSNFKPNLQVHPYSSARPPISTSRYNNENPNYYSTESPRPSLANFPSTATDTVERRILSGSASQSDDIGSYFDTYLTPSTDQKPHNMLLPKPNLMSFPNIIRKDNPTSIPFPFFKDSPSSSQSSGEFSILTSDDVDTPSPIFPVTEKPKI